MSRRIKTTYPGVFFRQARRIGGKGTERVYYIIFKKGGKHFEEKAGRQYADDMTPAKAAGLRAQRIEGKRQSRKEIREALKAQKNPWTIARVWEAYLNSNPHLKGLISDKNRFENYINPYFGNKEPQNILPLNVDRLRINLLKKRKPGTVKNVLELLRRIVNFAVKKNLCPGTPFKIQMPKIHNERTEDLSLEQLSALLTAIDEDIHLQAGAIMKFALFTGMRRGELFKLKWEDIDFQKGFINIRGPKGGEDQVIPLNEGARGVLNNHIKTTSPFVFPGRAGNQRKDIKNPVNRIKEKAGLPKNFRALHGLRHVYASILASSGKVDMYVIQRLLTHKDPRMTQRYGHLRDEVLKNASDVAGDIIKNIATHINEDALRGKGDGKKN